MEPAVKVEGVSYAYTRQWVLMDVSLEIFRGEIFGVVGPNASGKTTLIRLLCGLLRPRRGRVELLGRDLSRMSRREIARAVAVVPQESMLLYAFTVLDVVLMGRTPHLPPLGFEGRKDLEIAVSALEWVGCVHLKGRPFNELSEGERQRVLIARALAQGPRVLLMDEPTAHLDLRHQMDFVDLIVRLNAEESLTIVWVSHDLNLAALCCGRMLLLHQGRVFSLGPPQDVLNEESIGRVYGRSVRVDRDPETGVPRLWPRPGSMSVSPRGRKDHA